MCNGMILYPAEPAWICLALIWSCRLLTQTVQMPAIVPYRSHGMSRTQTNKTKTDVCCRIDDPQVLAGFARCLLAAVY